MLYDLEILLYFNTILFISYLLLLRRKDFYIV